MTPTPEQRALWQRLAEEVPAPTAAALTALLAALERVEGERDEALREAKRLGDSAARLAGPVMEAVKDDVARELRAERDEARRAAGAEELRRCRDVAAARSERDALALRVKGMEEALRDMVGDCSPDIGSTTPTRPTRAVYAKARAALASPATPGGATPTSNEE